jgi:uncharacterized protein (DUF2249 family)
MNVNVELATSREDAHAADAVRAHHAAMAGELTTRTQALLLATTRGHVAEAETARRGLVVWCETELVPHALAEEGSMYPAAHALPRARLLIEAMTAEHAVITGLVREIADSADLVRATAAARALQVTFETHLAKENDLVLPLLLEAQGVSVAQLLGGMHELLGGHEGQDTGHETSHQTGVSGHSCGCGETDPPGHPELDARVVPHAIRHATIFGALDAVPPGGGLVLVAPHDPLPLLAQVAERYHGQFETSYLQRGPEAWRLVFQRGEVA